MCGRGYIRMSEKAGNRCNIHAVFHSSCGKGMPERMVLHMGKSQSVQDVPKVMAQIIRIHHAALRIEDNKIVRPGKSPGDFVKPLVLHSGKIIQNIRQIKHPVR